MMKNVRLRSRIIQPDNTGERVNTTPDPVADQAIRRFVTQQAPGKLTRDLVQAMQSRLGNRRATQIIRRMPGTETGTAEKPTSYSVGDVLQDGEIYYRVVKVDENDENSQYWDYDVEELNNEYPINMSFGTLQGLTFIGSKTNEYWESLKNPQNREAPQETRDGRVFYEWEQGTTQPQPNEINHDYWEQRQSGVEAKHSRQFVSAEETKGTQLDGGGTAQVMRGVDYLKSTGTQSFLKRVGGFAYKYTNQEGRDQNLKWLQFLTTTMSKGQDFDQQEIIPRKEDDPESVVDHNSPEYPYYDPGMQSDQEIMMFDDPEPNKGTFMSLIRDGAKFVTEVDKFDTFLVRQGPQDSEQVLFHAIIEVTFTCDASDEPTEDGYPILKSSKIIKQEQATGFPAVLSKTLQAWRANKKKK